MHHVISGITISKFPKFLLDVGQLTALLMQPSAFQYSNTFWNANVGLPMKV